MIDFRSDTVTRPTPNMLKAMFSAKVGDDVFGDDTEVNQLEEKASAIFGMESALFCPSGTMTNQIAINIATRPGDEVICDQTAHVFLYEGGGIAKNSGSSVSLIQGDRGRINLEQVVNAVRPDDVHFPRTSIVCLENTSNKGGGTCYDLDEIAKISQFCKKNALWLHLDGARLFNALVKTGQSAMAYGSLFDSISICLSKGLGCPVGSLLLSSKEKIKQARRVRKVMGGGMRQAGYLAAAGNYALDHHIERLADDHLLASQLAELLKENKRIEAVWEPETNIVVADLGNEKAVDQFVQQLKSMGVLCVRFGKTTVRFVTHLDIQPDDLKMTRRALQSLS